ncbi:hypothetical protein ACLMJK_005506 [Lecanora helva]
MHFQPAFTFKKHPHIPFFRIFYSTTFTLLTLFLAAAVLISPGEQIYQSFHKDRIYHIFIIAGFYILTGIISLLIYGGRLYATRSALASIPREWIGEEGKGAGIHLGRVGKVVQSGLERSAWVAYQSKPRDLKADGQRSDRPDHPPTRITAQKKPGDLRNTITPSWGTISHPGWSSPSSSDLPNLHYEPVILELPHLIEAKAVSLAPPDPLFQIPPNNHPETDEIEPLPQPSDPPPPDLLIVSLLQRPASTDLRTYILHLTSLSMLTPPTLGAEFLTIYEQARFSGEELNEIEFRGLMSVFAEILRNMKPLPNDFVENLRAEAEAEAEAEDDALSVAAGDGAVDDDEAASVATNSTVAHTPQPPQSEPFFTPRPDMYTSSSSPSSSTTSSRPNASRDTIHTAPSRPSVAGRNDSTISRATRASVKKAMRKPSMPSLKPVRSRASVVSSAGSVIRLRDARTELELPFEFVTEG